MHNIAFTETFRQNAILSQLRTVKCKILTMDSAPSQQELDAVFCNPYVKEIIMKKSYYIHTRTEQEINIKEKRPKIRKLCLDSCIIRDLDMFPNLIHLNVRNCIFELTKPLNPLIIISTNEPINNKYIVGNEIRYTSALNHYDIYEKFALNCVLKSSVHIDILINPQQKLLSITKMLQNSNIPVNYIGYNLYNINMNKKILKNTKYLNSVHTYMIHPTSQYELDQYSILDELYVDDKYDKFHINNLNISKVTFDNYSSKAFKKLKNKNILHVTINIPCGMVERDVKLHKLIAKLFIRNKNLVYVKNHGSFKLYNNKYYALAMKYSVTNEYMSVDISYDLSGLQKQIHNDVVEHIIDDFL
jgi:hypothetical protein